MSADSVKTTWILFAGHSITVLDGQANSPHLNSKENLWGTVKRKMRDNRHNKTDELKAAIKATWVSITPQLCHRVIASMPLCTDAVICAKRIPKQVLINEQMFLNVDISVTLKLFSTKAVL